ncbi:MULTISPECIES: hypothetical protein [Bacillus cereus group]|uniref:hypothetical protein n=1 Tax=Bacillus cereus group TaxID=86661 RepID=UPI001596A556|nr:MULTISPECIES: hypothetical protein [Bacillus cereus group]
MVKAIVFGCIMIIAGFLMSFSKEEIKKHPIQMVRSIGCILLVYVGIVLVAFLFKAI